MKGKNVKGIIGLILALVSLICIGVAWIPLDKLTGMGFNGRVSFFGTANLVLIGIGFVCAIAAIVFAVKAKRDADLPGPRKSGMVVGIICIVLALISWAGIGLLSTLTEFINSDGQRGLIAEAIKNDENAKKQIDEAIEKLKKDLDNL